MRHSSILIIHRNGTTVRIPVSRLRSIISNVYQQEKIGIARKTHCICCSDYFIRKLNKTYRNRDKVTDVLSFPFNDGDLLGEIYISVRRTEIQAHRYGVHFNEEFVRLFTHGLLHLAGYDHIKESDGLLMERNEMKYINNSRKKSENR
jgi:probable rRNA maturation factor